MIFVHTGQAFFSRRERKFREYIYSCVAKRWLNENYTTTMTQVRAQKGAILNSSFETGSFILEHKKIYMRFGKTLLYCEHGRLLYTQPLVFIKVK